MILVVFSDASTLTGITDNKGQTYTIHATSATGNSGGELLWIAYKLNSVTGVTSFTATFTTSGGVQAWVYDCSSTTGGAFDNIAAFNNQSSTNPAPAVAAAAAGIAVCGLGSAAVTPSAVAVPFTFDSPVDNTMGSMFCASHDVNGAGGTLTSTFTAATSAWTALIASFKEAAASNHLDEDYWTSPFPKGFDPVVTVY